jgi:hypothetical protein
MNLEETETKRNCAGEGKQQFNRPPGSLETVSLSRVTTAEAEDISGIHRKGNVRRWKPLLRYLVRRVTETTGLCAVVICKV